MEISSRLVRQCVAIADFGTMSAAAEHLGLTPSTLSRALARFEEQTQLTVFRRSGSRLEPTEVGRDLLRAARRVVLDLDVVASVAADAAGGRAGTITIAAPPGAAGSPLGALVAAAVRGRPQLKIDIERVQSSAEALESLRDGHCQLALVPRLATPPDLAGVHIGRHELALIVPSAWIRKGLNVTDDHELRWLGEFPYIEGRPGTSSTHAMARLRRAGARPRVVVTNAPLESLSGLVAAGVGAAIITKTSVQQSDSRIRVVDLRPSLSYSLTLMHRPGEQSPVTRVVLDQAAELDASM